MGNSQQTYQEYQAAYVAQQTIPQDLTPLEVLGLAADYTWDDLKTAYRRTSLLVHPDKGGTEALFNHVTECFRTLAVELKSRESNKTHEELRTASREYYENNATHSADARVSSGVHPSIATGNNFHQHFNRVFEENRFEDEESARGYGDIMAPSTGLLREDISKIGAAKPLMKKFDASKFNETFDKTVAARPKAPGTEIQRYVEPTPMVLSKQLGFTEIGKPVAEFTSDPTDASLRLHYTDYKTAHETERLIDPAEVRARKVYKNVEEFQKDREKKTNKPLSDKERVFREQKKRDDEAAEEARKEAVRKRDEMIAQHHERVNQLLIGYRR